MVTANILSTCVVTIDMNYIIRLSRSLVVTEINTSSCSRDSDDDITITTARQFVFGGGEGGGMKKTLE